MICCPKCQAGASRHYAKWRCNSCRQLFTFDQAHFRDAMPHRGKRHTEPMKARTAGSGQIAGTITIGRGFKWGAGLV